MKSALAIIVTVVQVLSSSQDNVDVCAQPKQVGLCRARIPMYYYDSNKGECKRFYYGGCRGNRNRFKSLRRCRRTCEVDDVCLLPLKPGPCFAYFQRYYFDSKTKQCKSFIYGGCQGNGNNFKSLDQCKRKCKGLSHSVAAAHTKGNVCLLPSESGPCFAYFERYYFDETTQQCKSFIYGGCGGNENNFKSLDECEKACRGFVLGHHC